MSDRKPSEFEERFQAVQARYNELCAIPESRAKLVRQYQEGALEGADMLSAFLKHANDASELISRIVLHERAPREKI